MPLPETLPETAYRTDTNFRTMVDMLEACIHRADLTPHEVRAAAMLAMIHYEMRRPISVRVTQRKDGTFDITDDR